MLQSKRAPGELLNDVHSRLNVSAPAWRVVPTSVAALREAWAQAQRRGLRVAVCGGRHAMGGQQFLEGGCVIDLRRFDRLLHLDREAGTVTVQAGITWPALMRGYLAQQAGEPRAWGIRQKQTGADHLSVGGAIAANIHGRGLDAEPFACDLLEMQVLTPQGDIVRCSRRQEPQLFSLVVGGYGLFGIVLTATLQLVPRVKLERVVALAGLDELMGSFEARIADGCTYGDFQFSTDARSPGFLRDGVLSCYRPVDGATPVPANQVRLSREHWQRLLYLAHVDKARAYHEFCDFYLISSGQIYWSDTHQLNIYLDDYHTALDPCLPGGCPGTEMITELYAPRGRLAEMMAAIREDLRVHDEHLIYGTIRLIRRDRAAFLKWAREDFACVIFNLHVDHTVPGRERAAAAFRRLIDHAIAVGGSYFLTYHRHATREQLLRCYPEYPAFMRHQAKRDPQRRLSSDWFEHCRRLLASGAAVV